MIGGGLHPPGKDVAAEDAKARAEDAADFAEHDGFHDELNHDVPSLGADRAADADLARPFRHRDEHDIHDADARGQQRDRADNDHADAHGHRKSVELLRSRESLEKISKSSSSPGGTLRATRRMPRTCSTVSS